MYDYKKIESTIDKYNYISFDIFDTLIKRNIDIPTDLFEIIEKTLKNDYDIIINDFSKIRIQAEKQARRRTLNHEPNINDIYKFIKLDKKYSKELIKNLEIELEIKICQKNNAFYRIYEYCLNNSKKIVLTSDMYLPKEVIENILKRANIENYYKLFISNEEKKSKNNGKIYDTILEDLKIEKNEILHIGDSKKADYIIPKIKGINSLLIPNKILNTLNVYNNPFMPSSSEAIGYNILKSFQNNNIDEYYNYYQKFGYECLGPLIFGYVLWLNEQLRKNNIKKIFFLAREGLILKTAFDKIKDNNIQSTYLYISRKSIDGYDKEYIKIDEIEQNILLTEYIKQNNLTVKNFNIQNIEKYQNTKLCDLDNDIYEEIKKEIDNKINKKNLIYSYFKQEKVYGRIAISDVGWAGTMQKALSTIKDIDIYGYYYAIDKNKKNKSLKMYAYLNDMESVRGFVHLFEKFFLALHGSTLEYKFQSGKEIIPVLSNKKTNNDEMEIINDIQTAALKFVDDFIMFSKNININVSSEVFSYQMIKCGNDPSKEEISKFEKLTYNDQIEGIMIKNEKIGKYFLNPQKLLKDFKCSGWKKGFIKKVFGITIDYTKILNKR